MDNKSFTSADVQVPIKILHDNDLVRTATQHNTILLRHLQLCPTNRCNLNCEFCSCGDREKHLELDLDTIDTLLKDVQSLGCKAITITGGGEPLLHPNINEIIKKCKDRDIKVGLVTNGLLLDNLKEEVSWCRISFDSNRKFSELKEKVELAWDSFIDIDWAFSFVLYDGFGDLDLVVEFANQRKFTHVRVVADIFNPNDKLMGLIPNTLRKDGICDKRIIYQPRNEPTRGSKKCLISLLKPTIGANGQIYPCCGAQYAIKDSKRDFIKEMSMGHIKDIKEIMNDQRYFDGSICDVCYYKGYNNILGLMTEKVEHKEWV